MGYMIEITESKLDKMSGLTEQMLRAGGKLMQCLDEMSGEGGARGYMGERDGGRYGNRYGDVMMRRGGYSNRGGMGMRDDDEEWEEMQERRRRDSRGRYM